MAPKVVDPYGLVGRKLDGRYDVEAVVAEGGFGVVYRGRHPMLDRAVAIKVLRDLDRDEDARRVFAESFLTEAKTIATLEHPAVVRVLDFGVTPVGRGPRTPWMVLEWVDGRTLADELYARRGEGGRSPAECLALLRPVFEALAAAHEAGVAHRDIKPANVMIPTRVASGAPRARVLDFGVVKRMERDESVGTGETGTRADFVALSLPYASPEQVSATRTGPWTDVHALALILTEMLTDRAPYQGRDKLAVTAQVVAPERPTPARFGVDVGAWEPVLSRALSVRASARYPNARELLRALDEAMPSAASRRRAFAAWTALFFTLTAVPLVLALVVAPLRARRVATPATHTATEAPRVVAEAPPVTPPAAPTPTPAAPVVTPDAGAPSRPTPTHRAPRPTTFHGLPSSQI